MTTIQPEEFTQALADEIGPLGQQNWDECSEIKKEICAFHGQRGFKIEPDITQYLNLAMQGSLVAVTLRNDGILAGYALCVLYHSLHHAPVKCANIDSFYVVPESRSYAPAFMGKIEGYLKDIGIVVIGFPVTPNTPMFTMLSALGYAPDDVVMEKRICALQPQS